MTVVIHKKVYYTDKGEQMGPVEVYDNHHKFVGIGENRKLILGRKENGYFVESGRGYEIRIPLGDRKMFEQGKEGIACYVGYNDRGETETHVGYLIWKEDLAEKYDNTPVAKQAKIKKIWKRICEECERQMA